MDCLFCKILKSEIPAKIFYRDDLIAAFDDIKPVAPFHKLIVPVKHINTLNDLKADDNELIGHMVETGQRIARDLGFATEGYRLVFNCNADAGQTVFHIHMHLMGGRTFTWPPG
jgi:histidine triad (HIT) family protein